MQEQDPEVLDKAYKAAFDAAGKGQKVILMKSQHLTDQIRAAERDKNKGLMLRLIREQVLLFKKLTETYGDEDEP